MFSVGRKDKGIPFPYRILFISVMYLNLAVQHVAEFLPLVGFVNRHGLSRLEPHQDRLQTPALGRRNQPGNAVAVLVFLFKRC